MLTDPTAFLIAVTIALLCFGGFFSGVFYLVRTGE